MTQRGDLKTIWPGGLSGGPAQAVHIANPIISMEWGHHKVHAGKAFASDVYFSAVGSGSSADLLITTGVNEIHLVFEVNGGAELQKLLYEGVTATGGTPVEAQQMNRSTGYEVASAVLAHTPAVTGTGTAIVNKVVPGGSGGNRSGGTVRSGAERILRANTKYLIRTTNKSTGAVNVSISVEFYEEPV